MVINQVKSKQLSQFVLVSRKLKRLVMVFLDILIFEFCLWMSFAQRFSSWWPYEEMLSAW